jgi:hypothetical protein
MDVLSVISNELPVPFADSGFGIRLSFERSLDVCFLQEPNATRSKSATGINLYFMTGSVMFPTKIKIYPGRTGDGCTESMLANLTG